MELDKFCNDVVPDFTPLGGNRPDCAVVMAAVVSLFVDPREQSLVLPPDVLDTAMALVCAIIIIIRSVHDKVKPPPNSLDTTGNRRFSCRLEVASDAALNLFSDHGYNHLGKAMPWRISRFDRVCLQIALPDSINSCGDGFLSDCTSLVYIGFRHTKLHTLGNDVMSNCEGLVEVRLPDTLQAVGNSFLQSCHSLVSIDLRNTKLHTVGDYCMHTCSKLTAVDLPETLHTVGDGFLQYCYSLVSIDLRNTKLHTVGDCCLMLCRQLTEAHFPDTLQAVGNSLLQSCLSLVSMDLRNTKLHTAGNDFMCRCRKLAEVHLPDTLHSVGDNFCSVCESLFHLRKSIDLRNTQLQRVGTNFSDSCEVHLPEGLLLRTK